MLWLLFASLALAQTTVVALGDGLVAAPPPVVTARAADTVPGGWVTVLADCLEERAPRAFTVVDRASGGETTASLLERARSLGDLAPEVVVLGLGARELAVVAVDEAAVRAELGHLVGALRAMSGPPGVLLVGLVPPVVAQAAGDQDAIDAQTAAYNRLLAEVAAQTAGVHHVDLQGDWPKGRARAALTAEGSRLTDQGHARVAAAVCDAIVAHWPATRAD